MTEQLPLIELPPPAPKLTARQQLILDAQA